MKITIYYTKDEKDKLQILMEKYKVSTSTIADNVLFYLTKYLLKQSDHEKINNIDHNYIYEKDRNIRTTIKPKGQETKDNIIYSLYNNKTKAYTNTLKIYLKKEIKKYLTEENSKLFYQELNKKLQKTNEDNYNYNKFVRCYKRYEKQNKI